MITIIIDDYDYNNDETSDWLESCVDLCWYNEDYDYGNVDVNVVLCYYLCAEMSVGSPFNKGYFGVEK